MSGTRCGTLEHDAQHPKSSIPRWSVVPYYTFLSLLFILSNATIAPYISSGSSLCEPFEDIYLGVFVQPERTIGLKSTPLRWHYSLEDFDGLAAMVMPVNDWRQIGNVHHDCRLTDFVVFFGVCHGW